VRRRAGFLAAALAIAAAIGLAACASTEVPPEATPSVDPLSSRLLADHGLVPTGATTSMTIEIGDVDDIPWLLYREASQRIGLDFAGLTGRTAELRTTPIDARAPGMRLHVLVGEGTVLGAWLSADEMAPGIFSLDAPP
jgi:hypothetical protein